MTRANHWLLDGAENPLAPSSVVAELQAVNPRLGLNYHVGLRAFMVTLRWADDDPRRAYIQQGMIAPHADFEILFPAPIEMGLDELSGFVQRQLRRQGQSRADVQRMIDAHEEATAKANAALTEAVGREAGEMLVESVVKPSSVGSRRKRVR